MSIIEVSNIEFYGYHGCFKEEQIVGNYFRVDITAHYDASKAVETDKIADALNYQKIYSLTAIEMGITSHLLEHVAARILNKLFENFDELQYASVKVAKINPPLGGKVGSVSVTMERKR